MKAIVVGLALSCFGISLAHAEPRRFAESPGTFECETITRSSFVNGICFDHGTLVMLLRNTYYAYCDVPAALVDDMKAAESIGRFYNQHIKSDAVAGAYACADGTTKWTIQ